MADLLRICADLNVPINLTILVMVVVIFIRQNSTIKVVEKLDQRLWEHLVSCKPKLTGE